MDTAPETTELEVLSDEELAQVTGGAERIDAREFVLSKLGFCGCGLAH